jgi:hypothetical protein
MSMKIVNALVLLLSANLANAMDGEFDRSAEIDQYVAQLNSNVTHKQLIPVARAIHISGIGDERLASAISDRLLRDIGNLDSQYGPWMIRALASTGDPIAKETISKITWTKQLPPVKAECTEQLAAIQWHRHRNEVMASRRNYNEGDDMRVAQLLNLLQSDDISLRGNAAYRMNWDKILDPRLMTEIAAQLTDFVDKGARINNEDESSAMANYAKILGYSNDRQYVALLRRVVANSGDMWVRKAAGKALTNLKS